MKPVSLSFLDPLRTVFGAALQENVALANYTTARVGGPAAALLPVHTSAELEKAARLLWDGDIPFILFGSGSNVLVSDGGYPGVVLINRARNIKVDTHHSPPTVWAESGANLGMIARQVALRGLSGLEWAAAVPGSLGGAVYGNAGAHGGDIAGSFAMADILHRTRGREVWMVEQMQYAYRSSALKRSPGEVVLLGARLKLEQHTPAEVQARMDEITVQRKRTQPPGASMGSMFKNPAGDYAGRLIEASGLKGKRIGGAEISQIHANFFINSGSATAADLGTLIALTRQTVLEKFSILLELEVELIGEWPELANRPEHNEGSSI
jgi:UDP-N-acetylmuramate dehydrogenase